MVSPAQSKKILKCPWQYDSHSPKGFLSGALMTETLSRGQNFVSGTFFLRDKNDVTTTTIITPIYYHGSSQSHPIQFIHQQQGRQSLRRPPRRLTVTDEFRIFPLDDHATILSSPATIVGGGTTAVAVSRTSPRTYRRPTICSCCWTMTTSHYSRTSSSRATTTVAPSSTGDSNGAQTRSDHCSPPRFHR